VKKNLMPRIGENLETLGHERYILNKYETVYITLDDFKNKVEEKKYEIIAVKMNSLFVNNFELPSYNIFKDSKYFIFNTEFGMESTGGYSDNLKCEHSIKTLYVITPTYEELISNMINEVLTISEASELWNKDVSTLRRNFTNNVSFKLGIDCRKSCSTWLVTKEAMKRVYGEPRCE